MEPGELLTRWTVRLALAGYVTALVLRLHRRPGARLAWTFGFACFVVHVLVAFHVYHGWSHAHAYEETARRTLETTGFAFGGGLYLNYLFALVWAVDLAWWWCAARGYESRSRFVEGVVQGFFAFIALNATLVFGVGTIRWVGGLACVVLALAVSSRAASAR